MSKGTLMLNGVDYSNAGGGGSMVNYSTEEQVIGTWIDGKKLYQKTVTVGVFTLNQGESIDVSCENLPLNVDKYINSFVSTYDSESSWGKGMFGTIIVKGINTESSIISLYNIGIGHHIISNDTTYVTIQYTKTTD